MGTDQSVIFEAHCWPRRALLPDPSELPEFNTMEILSRADAFAAKYDVEEEVKS
jgi:hypothetical protein